MKSIGIYPGTFDPVHKGHIAFAKAAIQSCQLDIVYFIPERLPRTKPHVTALEKRIDTIRKNIAGSARLTAIRLESDHFTVEKTLPVIESLLGPANFSLLVGSDVAMNIGVWPECERLLSSWRLVVGMRNSDDSRLVDDYLNEIENKYDLSVYRSYVRTNWSDISSTAIKTSVT